MAMIVGTLEALLHLRTGSLLRQWKRTEGSTRPAVCLVGFEKQEFPLQAVRTD